MSNESNGGRKIVGPLELRTLASTVGLVVALAGVVGYAVGVGSWGGRIEQVLVEHERRLNAQDRHMEAIDKAAAETKSELATISAQLSYLVQRVSPSH